MHIEIAQAVEFLGRLLNSKVDSDTISTFKERLSDLLKKRFTDHWDAQQPYRGNAYRAISNFNGQLDPIIEQACDKAACSSKVIHAHLPRDFVLWVDPFSVSYRVGDHGNIMTLYEDRSRGRVSLKMDSNNNIMMSPSSSPRVQYIQPAVSTPIRISPPSSPENKSLSKPHLHQPSPLSVNAKKEEREKHMVMAN
ncbi:BTG-domain-containing protein [Backusella circina FSU 941]|nr:BTG-domain-containing protein [Backusella circina FSU 941]